MVDSTRPGFSAGVKRSSKVWAALGGPLGGAAPDAIADSLAAAFPARTSAIVRIPSRRPASCHFPMFLPWRTCSIASGPSAVRMSDIAASANCRACGVIRATSGESGESCASNSR